MTSQLAETIRAIDVLYQGTTSQFAETLKTEGDGGFIPRAKPTGSSIATLPEGENEITKGGAQRAQPGDLNRNTTKAL
jgi:hypothetical protein